MVKYNRIIMSKMHNGGLFMLTIREIKKAATLEEAWQLNQKRPNRVVGGMLWMRLSKGNEALLAAVNEAVAAALSDGSMETFVAEANELASGEKYEGLLDANGQVQQ